MQTTLHGFLADMARHARQRGLTNREWARHARLPAETLSRLKRRDDCDLATLNALAGALGLRLALLPALDREMPRTFDRDAEDQLLALSASRTLDLRRWLVAGPRFFMAGVAVLVGGMRDADREAMLSLAEALYPGSSSVEEFQTWMEMSPLRPSRFLPMLEQRIKSDASAT